MLKKLRSTFRPESGYRFFFFSLLFFGIGYGLYKGVIDNYLAEIVKMNEFDRGVAEFFRELPGLLLVFLLAVLYMCTAEQLYKIGAVIMLAGFSALSVLPANLTLVTVAICLHSLGEHIQLGMKNTLSMEYALPGHSGEALGLQNSASQAGTLAGYLVVTAAFLIISGQGAYRSFFLIAALFTLAGAVFSFRMNGSSSTDKTKSRFYFRKKFTKYYLLEVFYGARKQVFLTFVPYVLILFYKAGTATVSLLFSVSAVCCYFAAPLVGKIIDRVGYKAVMVADTLILVIVCFFYGFSHRIFPQDAAFVICCVNYVLDSVISLASMASNVYVKDISESREEVRATLSTGISVNHMITVLIALFGGWVWQALGIEALFTVSAVLGLLNSAYAASIKVIRKESTGRAV